MLLVGMDTPQLTAAAAHLLAPATDAVRGLAADGGWWAMWLRRPDERLLADVPMSTQATGRVQRDRLGRRWPAGARPPADVRRRYPGGRCRGRRGARDPICRRRGHVGAHRAWIPRPWYPRKASPSFLDALAALRRLLWSQRITALSAAATTPHDKTKITEALLDTLAYAAW